MAIRKYEKIMARYPKYEDVLIEVYKTYERTSVLPKKEYIFKALELTPFEKTKVVILGQDPYPNKKNATGLAFSVDKDSKIPQSLKNIFKELRRDLGECPQNGNLEHWAREGVLLLNETLTVQEGESDSHKNIGWKHITDEIIKALSEEKENLVFILWGKKAQKKESLIDNTKHLIIKSSHPSPFSVRKGFENSKPFSKTNNYLKKYNRKPIKWF